MKVNPGNEKSMVISYLALRKVIGIIGISLPFVLAIGAAIFFGTNIQSSVSSYYYTGMGDVFVGALCAIGVFLFSYKGPNPVDEPADDRAGNLGGVFAVGMALFPTVSDSPGSSDASFIGYIHIIFAAGFFLTLIYFSLFLFTKIHPTRSPSRKKLQRNKVYRVCGYIMILCILLIAIYSLLPNGMAMSLKAYHPVFWLEAIAVVAFGISWLTKGEAILKDEAEFLE